MSQSLPARPNIAYLKKLAKQRVKELRAGGKAAQLASVQRALAKEHGFKNWQALVKEIGTGRGIGSGGGVAPEMVAAFLRAAVPAAGDHRAGDVGGAADMLAKEAGLAAADIYAAAVTGSEEAMGEWLARDRKLATTAGGPHQWLPLSYLCFSRFLRFAKARRRKNFLACARLLLEAGADANSSFINEGDKMRESALYGAAGVANDAGLTRLLLEAGADVNDGETLYHVAEFSDHACLKLVLARKPENISFCLCHKMDMEDPAGVRLFLEHGADPNRMIERAAADLVGLRPLHFAILRNRSVETLAALVEGGADPELASRDGITPYALARRLGRDELAAFLERHGAGTSLSVRERFLAACSAGEGAVARKLSAADGGLVRGLSAREAALLPVAAGEGRLAAVRVMLDVGFPIDARGPWGGSALHQAAWTGQVATVKLLLARGASLTQLQGFGGNALQTAIHGSVHGGHARGAAIIGLIAAAMGDAELMPQLEAAREAKDGTAIAALEKVLAARRKKSARQD